MDGVELLTRAHAAGLTVRVDGDKLVVRGPRSAEALARKLIDHKAEVLALLRRQAEGLKAHYRQLYAGDGPGAHELAEMEERVNREGFVLCRSTMLDDLVAFHRDDVDPATLPPGFVPYSLGELAHLFPNDGDAVAMETLRLVHEAKKLGGRVTGNAPDDGEGC